MISDVLFDAVPAVEDYERSSPRTYADPETTAKIASVTAAMGGPPARAGLGNGLGMAMDGPIVTRGSLAEHSTSLAEGVSDMEGDEDLARRFGGRLLSRGTHVVRRTTPTTMRSSLSSTAGSGASLNSSAR